jgi:hypothetical protein
MFRKIAFGLVAAASISAAALAPTSASAKPFGFGGGFGGGWGGGWHHHYGLGIGLIGAGVGESCYVREPVLTPFGYRMRLVNVCY